MNNSTTYRTLIKFFLIVSICFISNAASAADEYTDGDGTDWATGGNWVSGSAPANFWGSGDVIYIDHDMIKTGTLQAGYDGHLHVRSGTLTINAGDLVAGGLTSITIDAGATLTVNGDVTIGSSGSSLTVNGNLNVTGSMSVAGGGSVSGSGTIDVDTDISMDGSGSWNTTGAVDVGGDILLTASGGITFGGTVAVHGNMTIPGSATATVTGTVTVDNTVTITTVGVIGGTGVIGWGTAAINGSAGGGHIACNDGTQYDNNAATALADIPANPLNLTTCGPVCSALVPGTITADQTICSGANVAAFASTGAASGGNGSSWVYDWESSTTSAVAGFSSLGAADAATYDHGVLATTTWFRRKVTSGTCGSDYSNVVQVTVNPNPTAAAGGALADICQGATSAAMGGSIGGGAAGGTWSGGAGTWTNASNPATATYTADAAESGAITLTLTTSGGSCGTTTATKNITVIANRTVGAASAATQTVCYNTGITSVTHATTGVTGITSSAGLPTGVTAAYAGNVITISGTPTQGGTFNYTITPTSTCGAATATGQIVVRDEFVAGTIADNQTIAYNTIPSTFTSTVDASGGGGFTYQWEVSTDNAIWGNAAGAATASTYTPSSAITQNTYYRRAAISTAGCGTVYTASVLASVRVDVCSGTAPPALAEAAGGAVSGGGGAGTYTYQWQKSTTSAVAGFADIASANDSIYTPTSITADTWYRRCVTSGACTACTDAVKATLQASPGAISGALVWLKADAGTSSIGTQWEDQSGNGNHYTTVSGPTLVSAGDSSSNYNPYISVLSGGFNAPATAQLGANYTIFAVAKKLTSGNSGVLFEGHISGYPFAFSADADTSKTVQVLTSATLPASGVQVDINQGFTGGGCNAHVYELIIYNSVLSASEISIIESYLETKYGIEGSNNYLASDGTTFFDVAAAGSYVNDVIGIGKECYFHQKQSSTLDDSLRVTVSATGVITDWGVSNASNTQSISNDISYLMIAHNRGSLKGTSATSADIPPAASTGSDGVTPITVLTRIDREWRITNTNFTDNYAIKFEVIPTGLTANDIVFMVDDDGDFTSGATLYFNGDGSGISISIGSIDVGGIGPGIIGAGAKFVALASKGAATVLPVELLNFTANKSAGFTEVKWQTASEINSDYFVIEKSNDGLNWNQIGTTAAAGNSNTTLDYNFNDYEHCEGTCYYRLRQVDIDKKEEFSKIVLVENTPPQKTASIKLYPNPVQGDFTVDYKSLETGMYEVVIYSSVGSAVYRAKVVCAEGSNVFQVKSDQLAPGTYYLTISDFTGKNVSRVSFSK